MEIFYLKDMIIILGLSIFVLLLCHRIKVPSIVGFLITGVVAGPQGLGLISAVGEVKVLAEIGIIALLFTVGLEFSIKKILAYKLYFLIAGPIQVFLNVVGGMAAGIFLGRPVTEAIFLGFLVSLSSTAIVMRTLQERGETNSPHGLLNLGVLIFQDVIFVLMLMVTPLLGKTPAAANIRLLTLFGQGLLILGITFFSAIRIVPWLLYHVAKTRSRELFLLTILVICLSVTWITSSFGLSLALGAFLAGLIVSESEYSFQAMGDIGPVQDIFTSFFFVSIGMLLDIAFFLEQLIPILFVTIGVFLMKSLTVALTALFLGLPMRTAVLSGIALSQVGEFSFVLALTGISYDIGTEYLHQLFVSIAVILMGLTPSLIELSPKIARLAQKLPLFHKWKSGMRKTNSKTREVKKNHIIVVGYGFSGKKLARSSKEAGVPYLIIDMNPQTVKEEKIQGEPIYFGDATSERVLHHACIGAARVVAVLVNDPIAALRIVKHARTMNPTAYIIVRTRSIKEMHSLFQLGANDVIPDELGSTIEIFNRVLLKFNVPSNRIEELMQALRTEGYEIIRSGYTQATMK